MTVGSVTSRNFGEVAPQALVRVEVTSRNLHDLVISRAKSLTRTRTNMSEDENQHLFTSREDGEDVILSHVHCHV